MKIIKNGDLERLKETKTFECKRCGCVFKAEKGEYTTRSQYNEIYYLCKCPTCATTVYQE